MRVLKIALLVVVGLGAFRIGWSFVDTGQLPNPINDLGTIVTSVESSFGDTLSGR